MTEYEWLTCEDPEAMRQHWFITNGDSVDRLGFQRTGATMPKKHSVLWRQRGDERPTIAVDLSPAMACNLIREVVGNPFKNVLLPEYVNLPTSEWLEAGMPPATIPWLTPSVRAFAQNIIDSGDYDATPVLADMLEEAGCDNEEILRHLRGEVRITYPPMRIETSIASINSSQSVNLTCGSADDESLANWDLAIFDRDWNHKKLETTVTSYQGDLKTVTFQKPCCSIFCGDNAVLSIQHKNWLPKPVPCQPGCWVLRLLTEEK